MNCSALSFSTLAARNIPRLREVSQAVLEGREVVVNGVAIRANMVVDIVRVAIALLVTAPGFFHVVASRRE